MRRSLSIAAAAVTAAATACGAGVADHHTATKPAASNRHAVHFVVAVTGRHHHLFANRLGHHRMRDLGGHLSGAPAVAWSAGQIFFVAQTRAGLSVRTERTSWAPLVQRNFDCFDPELTAHGGMLAVGCLRDNGIWAAEFAATSAGNPHVSALINQGGTLGVGPGVSFYGGQLEIEVLGGDYVLGRNYHANTYYRSVDDPPGQYTQDALYRCAGQPVETSAPAAGTSYFGCVARHRHHLAARVIGITPNGENSIPAATHVSAGRIGLAPITRGRLFTAYPNRRGETVVATLRYLHHPSHRTVVYHSAVGGAAITAGPHAYR